MANNGDGYSVADKSLQGVHALNHVTEAQLRSWHGSCQESPLVCVMQAKLVGVSCEAYGIANLVRVFGKSTGAFCQVEIEKDVTKSQTVSGLVGVCGRRIVMSWAVASRRAALRKGGRGGGALSRGTAADQRRRVTHFEVETL